MKMNMSHERLHFQCKSLLQATDNMRVLPKFDHTRNKRISHSGD